MVFIHIENFNLISSIVFDIFTPKKGKKWQKNAILQIFKSLIKSKRFELQGNEMAHTSMIYALILCKNFIPLFPLCFELRKFFGKKELSFLWITIGLFFLEKYHFKKNSPISLNYTILNKENYVY